MEIVTPEKTITPQHQQQGSDHAGNNFRPRPLSHSHCSTSSSARQVKIEKRRRKSVSSKLFAEHGTADKR
jgi:hypothetical protein